MNAEQIYRHALEQLAANGSPEAKMALSLADNAESGPDYRNIVYNVGQALRRANGELSDALRFNEDEWTRKTDRAIERARDELTKALIILATK